MKKVISLCLSLVLLAAAAFAAPTSAADDRLTVTANHGGAATYEVGDEFVFFVGLDTGSAVIINAECYIEYDANYVELVEYKMPLAGSDCMEGYSFPMKVAPVVVLNAEKPGLIRYNFSAARGFGTFSSVDELFVRFRFRAIAPGQTDITNTIKHLCDYNENYIYHNGVPNEEYQPVTAAKTTPVQFTVGDVDGNGVVDNRDALILDRYVAGWEGYDALIAVPDCADLSRDGAISLRDAVMLDRCLTGWEGYADCVFDVIN